MNAGGRGLPPPPGFSAPPHPPAPSSSAILSSNLPPLQPGQSFESAEHAKWWLQAKAEEEKRRQEEEKTKQEGFRLEQRRIEQSMLRDSIRVGVPPGLLPLIFAGINGVSTAAAPDYIQYPVAHTSVAEARSAIGRDKMGDTPQQPSSAVTSTPTHKVNTWSAHQHQSGTSHTAQGGHFISYSPPELEQPLGALAGPTSAPRSSQNMLPRLFTGGSQIPQILHSSGPHYGNNESVLSIPHATTAPISAIQFVPYVYPSNQTANTTQPHTPEYSSSPRKRKATGSHPPAPMPTLSPSPVIAPVGRSHSSASSYVVRSDNTSERRSTASPRVAQLLHSRNEVDDGQLASDSSQQRPRRQSLLHSPKDNEDIDDLAGTRAPEPHQVYRSRTEYNPEHQTPAAMGQNRAGTDPDPDHSNDHGSFPQTFHSRPPYLDNLTARK